MYDIRHRIGVAAHRPPSTNRWRPPTDSASGGPTTSAANRRSGRRCRSSSARPDRSIVMEVVELATDERVAWRCVEGPAEWVDTDITFDIKRASDAETVLLFEHAGWREPVEFMSPLQHEVGLVPPVAAQRASRPGPAGRSPTTSGSAAGTDPSCHTARAVTRSHQQPIDDVFRALADPGRRRLLDSLNARNGQNLSDAVRRAWTWPVSRSPSTWRSSRRPNLVVTVRRGRERLHYLNAGPDPRHRRSLDRPLPPRHASARSPTSRTHWRPHR